MCLQAEEAGPKLETYRRVFKIKGRVKTKGKGAYSKTKWGNLKGNRDVGTKSANLKTKQRR